MTMSITREQLLAETFVELADTLVSTFDVIDFLHTLATRTVALLDASAVGIMLADRHGGLQVMATSTEGARLMELFELQNNEGPCLDCYRTGQPVSRETLLAMCTSWPTFTGRLQELGFSSAQALPLRLRAETIGALNVFRASQGPLTPPDQQVGQALADIAAIGLIHERTIAASDLIAEQLQTALNSRILLEQAKGKLAERTGLQMDHAFAVMRDYARKNNRRLSEVAAQIVDGSSDNSQLRQRRHSKST